MNKEIPIDNEPKTLIDRKDLQHLTINEECKTYADIIGNGLATDTVKHLPAYTVKEMVDKKAKEKYGYSTLMEKFSGSLFTYMFSLRLNRLFLQNYEYTPGIAREICYVSATYEDIDTAQEIYGMSDPNLLSLKSPDGGYVQIPARDDYKNTITLKNYGAMKSWNMNQKMSDLMGVIDRDISIMGAQAKETEEYNFWVYFLSVDSALCTTTLSNLTTSALTQETLTTAITKFAYRKSLATTNGTAYLYVMPKYLVGGPATEEIRNKLFSQSYSLQPYTTAARGYGFYQDNLHRGKYLPLTTPYLTGSHWYLMADSKDPRNRPVFVMGLLSETNGQPVVFRQLSDKEVVSGTMPSAEGTSFANSRINYAVDHFFGFAAIATTITRASPVAAGKTFGYDGRGIYGKIA